LWFPQHQVSELAHFYRTHIFIDTVCFCRVDREFRDVTFYAEVIVSILFILIQRPTLYFHFMSGLERSGDYLSYTAHRLAIRTHDREDTHILQNIFRSDCLRTDT